MIRFFLLEGCADGWVLGAIGVFRMVVILMWQCFDGFDGCSSAAQRLDPLYPARVLSFVKRLSMGRFSGYTISSVRVNSSPAHQYLENYIHQYFED
jgi:hypothetical protein